MSTMTESVPMPLEWHPAYANETWLLDWLNGDHPPYDRVHVACAKRPLIAKFTDDLSPLAPSADIHTLIKRRCAGSAPYVGRPFVYAWWVGTDELGRSVAADATIQYRSDPMDDVRDWGPDPRSLPSLDADLPEA